MGMKDMSSYVGASDLAATESTTALPIVEVRALASAGAEPLSVRALIDTGSAVCIVSSEVATTLAQNGAATQKATAVLRTANGEVTVNELMEFSVEELGRATCRARGGQDV